MEQRILYDDRTNRSDSPLVEEDISLYESQVFVLHEQEIIAVW